MLQAGYVFMNISVGMWKFFRSHWSSVGENAGFNFGAICHAEANCRNVLGRLFDFAQDDRRYGFSVSRSFFLMISFTGLTGLARLPKIQKQMLVSSDVSIASKHLTVDSDRSRLPRRLNVIQGSVCLRDRL